MTISELKQAIKEGKTLIWNDPDPIPNADYTISHIEAIADYFDEDTPILIEYGKSSEAEVFVSEISIKEEPINKNKVAKLVLISLMTRVIVNEGASEEEILEAAKPRFQAKLDNNELFDNLEEIKDDTECPYDPLTD